MKKYEIYGDNISGGQHSSFFIILAENKKEAIKLAQEQAKEYLGEEKYQKWNYDEDIEEEDIQKGIIHFDTGDCC